MHDVRSRLVASLRRVTFTVIEGKHIICISAAIFDFFFSSRRRHTSSKRDWSSDVCSSDLRSTTLPTCTIEQGCVRRFWNAASLELASMAILRSLPNLLAKTTRPQRLQPDTSVLEMRSRESVSMSNETNHRPYHLLMAGFEALDLVNVGVVVTSASGQLLLANRTAEQILKTRDGLEFTSTVSGQTSLKSTTSANSSMYSPAHPA